jgi:outer membrane protein
LNRLTHLFLVFTILAVFQTASAQEPAYKIGFVNTARVLKEAPQARRVEERLKAEFEPREAQLKQRRQEILALEDQLKSDATLSSNTRRKFEREIRLKVSQLKFLLQQVISNVLKMQGDNDKFDLILTEGVSYVSDRIDITAQTIEMLKQLSDSSEEAQ